MENKQHRNVDSQYLADQTYKKLVESGNQDFSSITDDNIWSTAQSFSSGQKLDDNIRTDTIRMVRDRFQSGQSSSLPSQST
jgi:hypothetical protein